MRDASSLPWPAVREAYASSMHEVEEGSLAWSVSTQWVLNRLSALQYQVYQSCSQSNECNNMSCVNLIADGSVPDGDVGSRGHPVDISSCDTFNLHSLYDCKSNVDLMDRRYGSGAEIPNTYQIDGVQTMAIFN